MAREYDHLFKLLIIGDSGKRESKRDGGFRHRVCVDVIVAMSLSTKAWSLGDPAAIPTSCRDVGPDDGACEAENHCL